jgi:hypothetical protein
MSGVLEQVNTTLKAQPFLKAMSGIGVWSKVGWKCEGAGTLLAAVTQAEQAMDYMVGPIESGTAAGVCREPLLPVWTDTLAVQVVFAIDPSAKYGPDGAVSKTQAISYTIHFENDEDAPGDAQHVKVTDFIDLSKLDATKIQLQEIRFGNATPRYPTPGLSTYREEVPLGPNLLLVIEARIDYGVITWDFISLDPTAPGLPPAIVGFLPPNVDPPEGEGSVMFSIKPLASVADSATITNNALVTFDDVSDPMLTTSTKLGAAPPASAMLPRPSTDSTRFTLRWSGTGTGIRDYTIYAKKDNGNWWAWRRNTTATADTFASQPGGHTYYFYSEVRDNAGYVEPAPPGYDVSITTRTTGVEDGTAWKLALEGALPNPAIGELRVWFTLPGRERATLDLVDIAGRRVSRREVGDLGPGRHSVDLGSAQLPPGLYFIRLSRAGDPARTARAVYMK